MKPSRDTYEDLSFNVPAYGESGEDQVTVTSRGEGTSAGVALDFTKNGGEYLLTATRIPNAHDSASECEICGYGQTAEGEDAYVLCSHGTDMGAVTVTLATPIPASAVTGMPSVRSTSMGWLAQGAQQMCINVFIIPPNGCKTLTYIV